MHKNHSRTYQKSIRSEFQNLIPFVPASVDQKATTTKNVKDTLPPVNGDEIKNYYESLIKEKSSNLENTLDQNKATCSAKQKHKKKKVSLTDCDSSNCDKQVNQHSHLEMLKFAQNGDLVQLCNSIEKGVNVNFLDQFGWSALMCATVAGHVHVVECLLENGVALNYQNKNKQTARDLAVKFEKTKIVAILDNWNHKQKHKAKQNNISSDKFKFYCDICKGDFFDMKKHETSTAHLFNRQLKPKVPDFLIPESNRGFQLMVKHGWDKNRGLGPKGQGQKFPVKTVLKRDRGGLGTDLKKKQKITHFQANDLSSIKNMTSKSQRQVSVRTLSRREMRRRERKDKSWERDMRMQFNTD